MSFLSRLKPFPPCPPVTPNRVRPGHGGLQPPKSGHVRQDPSGPGGQGVVVDVFDPNRVAMFSAPQPTQSLVGNPHTAKGDPSGTTGGRGVVVGTMLEFLRMLRRAGIPIGPPGTPPPNPYT
ncbi:hypothetical protein D7X96_15455 [Corallococcus interemptor]|uniref:Uncharacterized protein n=2 Tax=Corallococcus TaxID=83461 RepID=A0A3A8QQP7_9BACT|nr:hypothetical protein [Corallococcus interemptor]RKH41581.1 hypothetical protein D7Y23_32825 [Corallococcus sp. AB050B]RKH69230.1 hypothetical protein D7X96_15455 [Corallococcus interemptor]